MRLNLASHGDNRPGYINVDFDHPTADVRADVAELPFEDESADVILAYHILEHFRAGDYEAHLSNSLNTHTALEAATEWYRVLKTGGRLEIKVPDFEKIIWQYQENPEWSHLPGPNPPFRNYTDWLCSNGQHQCVFDKPTMEALLRLVGFEQIEFIDVPPRKGVNRQHLEMYVVCHK